MTVIEYDSYAGRPTFLYHDINWAVGLAHVEAGNKHVLDWLTRIDRDVLVRLAGDQRKSYEQLTGLLTFSNWFRDWVVEHQGMPREKVHAVGAGTSFSSVQNPAPARRGRLLFLGREFDCKGGRDVVAAVHLLRDRHEDVTLTVAGPARWPMSEPPPPGVNFVGPVRGEAIGGLWSSHDLLVMPSHFEAYGIVFNEALASGIPCVGRRQFAMPELIGESGCLIEPEDGPEELAEAIIGALSDDELYRRVWHDRSRIRRERSWDAVATRIVATVRRETGLVG